MRSDIKCSFLGYFLSPQNDVGSFSGAVTLLKSLTIAELGKDSQSICTCDCMNVFTREKVHQISRNFPSSCDDQPCD